MMRWSRGILSAVVFVVLSRAVFGQGLLFQISQPVNFFGKEVERIGDLDHDGRADVLIGSPSAPNGAMTNAGAAIVYSSATLLPILTCMGSAMNESIGTALSADCDMNSDGISDIVVGAYGDDLGAPMFGAGKVLLYSGANGQKLFGISGPHLNAFLATDVASVGDVDLDGIPDFAASAPGDVSFGPGPSGHGAGSIFVYSGSNGSLLRNFPGSNVLGSTGRMVRGVGDIDQDGVADVAYSMEQFSIPKPVIEFVSLANLVLVASIPNQSFGMTRRHPDVNADGVGDPVLQEPQSPYRAMVLSGQSLQPILYSQQGASASDSLGDVNQDGIDDIMAAVAIGDTYGAGAISGADGSLLGATTISLSGPFSGFIGLGDVNGDGKSDLAVGEPHSHTVSVYSFFCGGMTSYGSACPPTVGATPALLISDSCATPGGTWNMFLSGPPGSALLMVGAQPAAAYIGGGCQLLVGPPATLFPIPFTFGFSILNTKLPLTSPVGKLCLQLFTPDATKPWGYASSKGLEVSID